ncbi:putative F-box/kelch-repeat protein At3g17540 [Silene latifolia]|uniref:putative F-box/kelch-repeat protein At3g17540 n=1 Tax=Silene latifolia TaxID=37657 RepID=UPI003D76F025
MKRRKKRKTSTNLPHIPETSPDTPQHLPHIPEFMYVPPEVWSQIFAALPTKTLVRLRCVCKSWCSIIDHPTFVSMHLQIFKINSGNDKLLLSLEDLGGEDTGCLVTVREAETLRNTGRIFRKSDSYSYHMIAGCNGLFLVNRKYSPHRPFYGKNHRRLQREELRLWNPCIRKSLVLPTRPRSPLLKNSVYLLGFDAVSKDYKVVAIAIDYCQAEETTKTDVAVYRLSNQQWTVRDDYLNISYPYRIGRLGPFHSLSISVFFRGSAYWLGQIDKNRIDLTHLGSFNFDSEKITFSKLPFTCDESGSLRFLFLLGESLAVFSISLVASSIWVLQQDNEKFGPWTLWFSGESNSAGYKIFKGIDRSKKKIFYCESDGGYFVLGKRAYNIASCEVHEFKRALRPNIELETYSESLALSKEYGSRDLRSFP